MCIGCKHMSLDDLDEKLFAAELNNATQHEIDEPQPTVSSSSKWFPWQSKQSHTATNEETSKAKQVSSTSTLDGSRRGSVCSAHSSPNKSSPRRSKDHSKRNLSEHNEDHNVKANLRKRKEQKEGSESAYGENKITSSSHLYSVLEEKVLGEMIHESMENVYVDGNKSLNYRTTAALSTNTWY